MTIANKFRYQVTYANGKKSQWGEFPDIELCLQFIEYYCGESRSKNVKQVIIEKIII